MLPSQDRQIKRDRRKQDAAIGTQQDAGRNRRAGRGPELVNAHPPASLLHPAQGGGRAIQSERGKEDLQSFGERGDGIVREEGTQRGQDKSDSRRAFGNRAAGEVGKNQAGAEVEENLRQQDGSEVASSR